MKKYGKRGSFVLTGLLLLSQGSFAGPPPAPVALLTAEEAALPPAPEGGLTDVGGFLESGPGLDLLQPAERSGIKAPLMIMLRFSPNPGKPVDLATLKVEVLKIVTVDITKRILPFASRDGIKMEKADLPSGDHRIRVTVGDDSGGVTQKVFYIKVL